jgi:hypothetical protein
MAQNRNAKISDFLTLVAAVLPQPGEAIPGIVWKGEAASAAAGGSA